MFWIKFDLTNGILVNNKSEHDWFQLNFRSMMRLALFICSIHSTLNQANSL